MTPRPMDSPHRPGTRTTRRRVAALDGLGIYFGAATLALLASALLAIKWWHPYCDVRDDGPGHYAWGLPLPYAQPTGVSTTQLVGPVGVRRDAFGRTRCRSTTPA